MKKVELLIINPHCLHLTDDIIENMIKFISENVEYITKIHIFLDSKSSLNILQKSFWDNKDTSITKETLPSYSIYNSNLKEEIDKIFQNISELVLKEDEFVFLDSKWSPPDKLVSALSEWEKLGNNINYYFYNVKWNENLNSLLHNRLLNSNSSIYQQVLNIFKEKDLVFILGGDLEKQILFSLLDLKKELELEDYKGVYLLEDCVFCKNEMKKKNIFEKFPQFPNIKILKSSLVKFK